MILTAYKYYWKNAFKFRSVSTRGDFWPPTIITWSVLILLFLFIRFVLGGFNHHMLIGTVWVLWFVINLLPSVSLTIRRMRDVGVTGWALLAVIILVELFSLFGWFGLILELLLLIGWLLFLSGDSDVMPEGWWSPDTGLDEPVDTVG